MSAAVVIFAVGNPSRGDDALGPALLSLISDWLAGGDEAERFELIEDFQLQIEHALDLVGRDLALFIDAGTGTPAPFTFAATPAVDRFGPSTHALTPGAVLQVFADTEAGDPPPAYTLCIAGSDFELGAPISEAAEENLAAAFEFVLDLLAHPEPGHWSGRAASEAQR